MLQISVSHCSPIAYTAPRCLISCPESEVDLRKGVFKLSKDRICGSSPGKRFGFFVVFGEVGVDSGLKLSHRREASASNGLCSDRSKEALDHVEPGTASGSEMKMKAGMTQQPAMDFRGFMGGIVVNDEVKLAFPIIGERGVDTSQEGQEFLVAVTLVAQNQNSSGGRIVSGKKRKSPVTHIIMSLTLGQTGTQWQNGLAALERLSLALLIDTKHNGFIGRIQIKPHNITHLLYKHRVGTQLEGVHPMGFEPKGAPNSQHRMLRNDSFFSHETAAPVGSSPWSGLQRLSENLLDLLVVDASRSSAAGRISQRLDLLASITAAPLANRGQSDSFTSGDLGVTQPSRGFQNDPRPQRSALVGLGPVRYQGKFFLFRRA